MINRTFTYASWEGHGKNMKIKIALCTSDVQFGQRVVHYFQSHYYDKFAWNVFTGFSFLMDFLKEKDADIILVGEELKSELEAVPAAVRKESICAYLAEDEDGETFDDREQSIFKIEKYLRADKLYRELLELYSKKSNIHFNKASVINDKTEIYAFVSPSGGAGCSTAACAAAQGFARYEKVLYIGLETIGAQSLVFDGEASGGAGFDEVIFALKSRRKVLELKISSSVSRDKSGVFFFRESANALDTLTLSERDYKELFTAIGQMREYDKVILDVGNGLGEKEIAAMTYAGRVVVIVDESRVCEKKLVRYVESLQLVEEQKKADICSKMILFYNKVLNQRELLQKQCGIRAAGGFPKIENGTYEGVIGKLAQMEIIQNMK